MLWSHPHWHGMVPPPLAWHGPTPVSLPHVTNLKVTLTLPLTPQITELGLPFGPAQFVVSILIGLVELLGVG